MLDKKLYSNGQKVYELNDNFLTYYYKNGIVRAKGKFIDGLMEGEWIFYRESGHLWQVSNFRNNLKHGSWVRYDKSGNVEYHEFFENNKQVNKKNYG
jgi:antitoxin component YwqK of YwqJK toxin-antitoxin module